MILNTIKFLGALIESGTLEDQVDIDQKISEEWSLNPHAITQTISLEVVIELCNGSREGEYWVEANVMIYSDERHIVSGYSVDDIKFNHPGGVQEIEGLEESVVELLGL